MEPADLCFLQIVGYSLSLDKPITAVYERAVRFEEDGTPNWLSLLNVSDIILFELEVDEYVQHEKHEPDSEYVWFPYIFRTRSHGDCQVRVWMERGL